MRKMILAALIFCIIANLVGNDGKQPAKWEEASWEELRNREYPEWFTDAKLGIFIHWGLYSVPSWSTSERYAEWYYRWLTSDYTPVIEHHNEVWGADFEYKDFTPLFSAELFDASEWTQLFEKAGAKYIIFVSKHHDGYCLWDSEYAPDWNSVDNGPGRDFVKEISDAVKKSDLRLGLYYSLPEWTNPLHKWYLDPHEDIAPYVNKHMIPQFKELVSAYEPDLVFADGEWFNSAEDWHARELIGWYYDQIGSDAIVNNRWGGGSDIGFITPEYSSGMSNETRPWTECRGLGRSFGLNRNESLNVYLTPEQLIHFFVKAVANGGGMTLNVGPKADGQIPLIQQERLLQLGKWLDVNGEAIYGSEQYIKTGEKQTFTVERIDKSINFDWVRNTPCYPIEPDNFQAEWTGFIVPKDSGQYSFSTEADDEMTLWIDEQKIIDQDNQANSLELMEGYAYPVKISYKEKDVNAHIKLFWSKDGQEKTIVPETVLLTPDQKEHGLKGTYSSQGYRLCYTQNNGSIYAIALNWQNEIILNLENTQNVSSIELLGYNGTLNWKASNNQIIINTDNINYKDIPCDWAWTFKISLGD